MWPELHNAVTAIIPPFLWDLIFFLSTRSPQPCLRQTVNSSRRQENQTINFQADIGSPSLSSSWWNLCNLEWIKLNNLRPNPSHWNLTKFVTVPHLVVRKVSHLCPPLYLHKWDLPHLMSSSLGTEEEFHNLNEDISLCVWIKM